MDIRTALSPSIELFGISLSIEITFDENASATTIDFPGSHPEDFTVDRRGENLRIRQDANRSYTTSEQLTVRGRRQARQAATQQNIPLRDRVHFPNVEKDGAPAHIVITTGPATFRIMNCLDVTGTIQGNLSAQVNDSDYLGISGAGDITVVAAGDSTVALTNIKGNLNLTAINRATITIDSAPGEIQKYTAETATIKVV